MGRTGNEASVSSQGWREFGGFLHGCEDWKAQVQGRPGYRNYKHSLSFWFYLSSLTRTCQTGRPTPSPWSGGLPPPPSVSWLLKVKRGGRQGGREGRERGREGREGGEGGREGGEGEREGGEGGRGGREGGREGGRGGREEIHHKWTSQSC